MPVSALRGIDDNGDRVLSKTELSAHAREIREQVDAGVRLRSPDGLLPLQLMMVDVETSGEASTTGARQVTILGRFQLRSSVG
ncbi:MAG: hypothetical protein KGO50_19805, partial [Myxococcales bacterium]|nr:hypothetical protein [Myxococcales bacterium]